MAGATAPRAHQTYPAVTGPVVAYRLLACLTITAGALLPFAKAASWETVPLTPPPIQPSLSQPGPTTRLQPGEIVALQVVPYRE